MTHDSDSRDQATGAMFRSSRRVAFVVRSADSQERPPNSRVSRDPMGSDEIDIRDMPPQTTPRLGLEGDWRPVIEAIGDSRDTTIALETDESGSAMLARVLVVDRRALIAAGSNDTVEPAVSIFLDPDLHDMVRSKRAAIELDLEEARAARLVSYKSVSHLLTDDADERDLREDNEEDEASSQSVAVDPPVERDDRAPDPKVTLPAEGAARLRALISPRGFPDALEDTLTDALGPLKEFFEAALLFQAEYVDGHTEYLVGFSGVPHDREDKLEDAVNAALAGSRRRDVELGITFLEGHDPMLVRISRVGHRLA